MKKLFFAFITLGFSGFLQAQQTQGRVVYEHKISLSGEIDGRPVPINFNPGNVEVLFSNGQSLLKKLPKLEEVDESEGLSVRIDNPVSNEIVFTNLKTGKSVLSQDFSDKKYLIADTINKLSWTLTGETKTIHGHVCKQATSKRKSLLGQQFGISKEEGQDEFITVWFAPSIPVAAGPDLQGQLPGLILEINIDNGKIIYTAIELEKVDDISEIKEPVVGTWITKKDFTRMCDESFK